MKKAIKALWHGIKVVFTAIVDWVATLFGMKDNSKYGHVLHRVVGTAFAVVVIVWALASMARYGRSLWWNIDNVFDFGDDNAYFSEQLSENISFYRGYWGHYGYLKNAKGKKVLKHISRIGKPMEGDSLAFFSDGEKRGYFHMRDGRLVIKPIYEHAWIFSDGLAAVEVNRRIKFIDTTGTVVIDKGFVYDVYDDGYVFHQGHCAVNDSTGKHMGLIDRNGDWVVPPVYSCISPQDTFWLLTLDNLQGLLSFGMDTVVPLVATSLSLGDTAVEVVFADHTQSTYNLQGELIGANQIRGVEQMMYETREVMYRTNHDVDEETEIYYGYDDYTSRKAVATCLKYEAESSWYGLMSPDGKMLTPPSYVSIEAVDKDLYFCETSYGRGVLLNSKGQQVE